MTTEKQQGLFDKLYAAAKEVFDAAKKPLVKNRIKRKLSAAYDDASNKILEAEASISKTREDFENYDVNIVLNQKKIISQCESLKELIKNEWKELFATEMKTGEDNEE